jgi:FkbM family methyltransferase
MIDDLIFDIGMHNGDDTAYYLFKGYRVVAVEANPVLVEHGRARFQREIEENRLTILPVGVAPAAATSTFWVNDVQSDWSSFDREVGCRDGMPCHAVEVPCVPLRDLMDQYGVPYYLKIDIEGYDIYCLEDIDPDDPPGYVSTEANSLEYLVILARKGYNAFKCIRQSSHHAEPPPGGRWTRRIRRQLDAHPALRRALTALGVRRVTSAFRRPPTPEERAAAKLKQQWLWPAVDAPAEERGRLQRAIIQTEWLFPSGSSGPFGEDTPGEWRSLEEVAYQWLTAELRIFDRAPGGLSYMPEGVEWYDFHATRKGRVANRIRPAPSQSRSRPWR